MWHWDQGHLPYFQFDALRVIAKYATEHDFRSAGREELAAGTGFEFAGPPTHNPWRQYSRVLKICLLVAQDGRRAVPTPIGSLLSIPGEVTCDEYMHFLVRAFTEPSPALSIWTPDSATRRPLLFALKYLLAKEASHPDSISSTDHIIGAYVDSGFQGSESLSDFTTILRHDLHYEKLARTINPNLRRQARESLLVISQISYLFMKGTGVLLSLGPDRAREVFEALNPVAGEKASTRDAELLRLASIFQAEHQQPSVMTVDAVPMDLMETGFLEGTRVKRTHVTLERNPRLRSAYFAALPTSTCDMCRLDTKSTYPWTNRILDLHHLLPLSSGARVESMGTTMADIVPVCPTCHRAIHSFYDRWLRDQHLADFPNDRVAKAVYSDMKREFNGVVHV